MKKALHPENMLWWLTTAGYLLLLLLTCLHRQPPLFDEVLFIPNVYLLEKYGLSETFLLQLHNQAPGPLYQFVHYLLQPVTQLQPPGIRLVNTVLLGIMIPVMARIIVLLRKCTFKEAWSYAMAIMAVPMVWQVAGMALTEIPPMFFSTLSILWLLRALHSQQFGRAGLWALAAGLALGLAILGRSPFLLLVPAAACLLVQHAADPQRWFACCVYMTVAVLVCLPVFLIWRGLMPPQQAMISAGGIRPWHGVLALAYAAMLTFIIAPQWFVRPPRARYIFPAVYLLLFILNYYGWQYVYAPLSATMERVLPAVLMHVYPWLAAPLLMTIALYFLGCCLWQAWQRRGDIFFIFLLSAVLLMLASCVQITHLFSSRYVAQTAPLLVLLLPGYDRPGWQRCLRFAAGMLAGLLSLETYFLFR